MKLTESRRGAVLERRDVHGEVVRVEIDPSILGTLFERGLGAHYTDRDKIMLLVEPVVIRPLLVEWDAEKTAITVDLERAEAARSAVQRRSVRPVVHTATMHIWKHAQDRYARLSATTSATFHHHHHGPPRRFIILA